jgi:diguanylate cyclase
MTKELNVVDVSPKFEEKVFTIADEVFKILKELSLEHKTEIKSDQIAERMFYKDSLKGLLDDIHAITEDEGLESKRLSDLSNLLLDKFSEIIPAYLSTKLGNLKDALHDKSLEADSKEWIDSPMEILKDYIDLISVRNNELEDFLNNTMENISGTEENMSQELSLKQRQINNDIEFENSISSNIDELKQDISGSDSLKDLKSILAKKLENIYNRIELKRTQDEEQRKEADRTIEAMRVRISEIKRGAEEIRRKSGSKEYEANHDALTGVYNRKAYEKKMQELLADVSRYGVTASLVVCDVDFFMKINDKFGHKIGDLALKKLAMLIKERMRINDFIVRYGGDVFAVILPHTGIEGAGVAGERLRSYIDEAVFGYKGEKIPLTISIGICCLRKDDDINSVFARADRALRLAKNSGRNRMKTEEDAA